MDEMPSIAFIALTPAGIPEPRLAIAGCRAGALGVLNLEFTDDRTAALATLAALGAAGNGPFGVLLDCDAEELLAAVLEQDLPGLRVVILAWCASPLLADRVTAIHQSGRHAYGSVT